MAQGLHQQASNRCSLPLSAWTEAAATAPQATEPTDAVNLFMGSFNNARAPPPAAARAHLDPRSAS